MGISPILIIDEEIVAEPLCTLLNGLAHDAGHLLPISGVEKAIIDCHYKSLVIEPFFFFDKGQTTNPVLDRILEDAHSQKARILFLSSQSQETLNSYNLRQGENYDAFLYKPAKMEEILRKLEA